MYEVQSGQMDGCLAARRRDARNAVDIAVLLELEAAAPKVMRLIPDNDGAELGIRIIEVHDRPSRHVRLP